MKNNILYIYIYKKIIKYFKIKIMSKNKEKKVLLTEEWLQKIKDELNRLKNIERWNIAEKLKIAISYWDLSENSEYEDARSEQARVEYRISELEDILLNYEIISDKDNKTDIVNLKDKITIESTKPEDNKETHVFKIVWALESDIFENKISNESIIGSSLIWKKLWDIVTGKAPSWDFSYKIIKIN